MTAEPIEFIAIIEGLDTDEETFCYLQKVRTDFLNVMTNRGRAISELRKTLNSWFFTLSEGEILMYAERHGISPLLAVACIVDARGHGNRYLIKMSRSTGKFLIQSVDHDVEDEVLFKQFQEVKVAIFGHIHFIYYDTIFRDLF